MKSKDELDILIKELSEKQQAYKTTTEDEIETTFKNDIPELIPVDFNLEKNLYQEPPVAASEEVIQPTESMGFFESVLNKLKNMKFNFDIKKYFNKIITFIKQKPKMFALILTAILILVGLAVFSSGCSIFNSDAKAVATLNKEEPEDSNLLGADRINILLLGIDSPDGKFNERSDTIILLSLDAENGKISALSIPRDTYVTIPGHGKNKINAANEIGGPELVVKTISELLAVQIDHYAVTNFNGFIKIIDTLGGVELDVEKNMYYRTYNGTINLKKGLQKLDGDKALQYVRFRHDALGDISRTQRQQKFMLALAKEIKKPQTLLKLPKLLPEVAAAIKTDFSLKEMVSLASAIKSFDLQNINTQTLPGNFVTIKGISYWYVDEAQAKQVVLDVFVGKTNGEIVDPSLRPQFSDPDNKKFQSKPTTPKPKTDINDTVKKDIYPNNSVQDGAYTGDKETQSEPKVNKPETPQNPTQENGNEQNNNQQDPAQQNPSEQDPDNQNPVEQNPDQQVPTQDPNSPTTPDGSTSPINENGNEETSTSEQVY